MTSISSNTTRPGRVYLLFFLLLSTVYHSNLRPVASGDSLPASLIPFSVLLDGSIALDRFGPYIDEHVSYRAQVVHQSGGHWYSIYPIAGPVLATPLYLPVAFVPWIRQQPPGALIAIARVFEKVVAVALAAAAAVLLLALLRRLTSARMAWLLALVFALGTANWSTASQALWQHTYGQLAIVGCFYSIVRLSAPDSGSRWYWIAGACAACALAIRLTNVTLLAALVLVLWLRPARFVDYLRVFLSPALTMVLLAAYNAAVFQSFRGGYRKGFSGDWADGLLGILVSPGRGLLIYTPIALFALMAFAPRARESRRRHRLVVVAAGVFSLLHIALIAKWPGWWGGYCWGPRLLTEISAPLIILIATGLPAIEGRYLQRAFAVAALYGCFIQAIGVYCYPKGRWDHLPVSVNQDPARLWDWADNPIVRTARGGIVWEPFSIAAAAATGGWPAAAKRLQELGINPY